MNYFTWNLDDSAGFDTAEYRNAVDSAHAAANELAESGSRLPEQEFWMFLQTETARILNIRVDRGETVFSAYVNSRGGNGLEAEKSHSDGLKAFNRSLPF